MNSVAIHQQSGPEWQFLGMARDVFGFHPESGKSSLLPGVVLSAFKIRDLHRMSDRSIAACRGRFEACAAGCSKKFDCLQVELQEAIGIRDELLAMEQALSGKFLLAYHHKHISEILADWDELVTDLSISADPEIHSLAAEAAALL
jgi:hypothetical protein